MADLYEVLERIATVLRAELRADAAREGLAAAQLEALRYLARCDRSSDMPAALAAFVGATRGTISQTLRTLEARGLVEKRSDPRDRRVVHCRLTPAGEQVVQRTAPPPLPPEATAALPVPPESLQSALVALLSALQQRRAQPPRGRPARGGRRDAPADLDEAEQASEVRRQTTESEFEWAFASGALTGLKSEK